MNASLGNCILLIILIVNSTFNLEAQINHFTIGNDIGQRFIFKNKKTTTLINVGDFQEVYIDTVDKEIILPNALLPEKLYCMLGNIGFESNNEKCNELTGPFNVTKIHHSHSDYLKFAAYIGKIEMNKFESGNFYLSDLVLAFELFDGLQPEPNSYKFILYLSLHLSVESVFSDKPVVTIINIYKLSNYYSFAEAWSWGFSYLDHLSVYTSDRQGKLMVR